MGGSTVPEPTIARWTSGVTPRRRRTASMEVEADMAVRTVAGAGTLLPSIDLSPWEGLVQPLLLYCS